MANYTSYIGTAGGTHQGGLYSLGITLSAYEYPASIAYTGTNWYVPVSAGGIIGVSLCNTGGGNGIEFLPSTFYNQGPVSRGGGSATLSGGTALSGQSLALYVYATNSTSLEGVLQVTITTNYQTYSITIVQSTGGTVTANYSTAVPGTVVSMSVSASTGYYLSYYIVSPSSTTISNNQFSMPASNITIQPVWAKYNYTITKVVSPSGAGTITAPSTATYNATVSISQTPSTGYSFSSWSISPSRTITNNSFTMPNSNVTLTANYVVSTHTLTWTSANLTITQSSGTRIVTAKKVGYATDNFGESVTYYLRVSGAANGVSWTEMLQFVGNYAVLKLTNERLNTSNTYELVAASSIEAVGATKTFTAVLNITNTQAGYYDGYDFLPCVPYRYNGSTWVECEWKYRDGSVWLDGISH